MKVKELLDKIGHDVYSVSPDTTVFEALKLMAEKEIGAVLILEGKKIVGIMSERDYARKVILLGRSSKETSVKEIMSRGVVHTNPEVNVEKCLRLMMRHKFRYLPVMEQGRLIGIISIDDVRSVT